MENITKQQARERGLDRYFTGSACKHGHLDERYLSSGVCVSCSINHNKAATGKYQETRTQWRERNKERVQAQDRERAKAWHQANKDRYRKTNSEWAAKNRDHLRRYQQDWRDRNRTEIRLQQKKLKVELRKDPIWCLKNRISSLVRQSLKKHGLRKTSKTCQILGCDYEFFVAHIERQFLKGMSWTNRHLWHIDHITPLASATSESDVIALNHFTNLRPIWATDNISKSDKILFLI